MRKSFYLILLTCTQVLNLYSQNYNGTDGLLQSHNKQTRVKLVSIIDLDKKEPLYTNKENAAELLLKSTANSLELLDSVVKTNDAGEFISKTVYEYDDKDRTTLSQTCNWDNLEQCWMSSTRIDYSYSQFGEIRINSTWDTYSNIWVNTNKYVYEFDSNNEQITLYEEYQWDESWICILKEETVWGKDAENTTMMRIKYSWDDNVLELKPDYKEEAIFYGETSIYKQHITYDWTNDLWVPEFKMDQLYNDDGYDKTYATYSWNSTEDLFEGTHKNGYIYNEDNSLRIEAFYQWDNEFGDWKTKTETEYGSIQLDTEYTKEGDTWIPVSRIGYENGYVIYFNLIEDIFISDYKDRTSYGNSGNLTDYSRYDWDSENNRWYNSHNIYNTWDNLSGQWKICTKIETKYNRWGMNISRIQLYRYSSLDQWIESYTYKIENQYNDNAKMLSRTVFNWGEEDWNDNNPNEESWLLNSRLDYYYSPSTPTNNENIYSLNFKTYPNPVKNILTIVGTLGSESIQLFNIKGEFLREYSAKESETIVDLSFLAKGMFIVNIEGATYKILKD
ncbi:T9SS type A sorting domain-containing protein [Geofilum rubicundum]|uniref:Secretion system C-terminal sorting domain-containing protein n=1 Tax=Geofilum rubicundum JCM 15548 TaxID=1236989 RepID=A0A0E9M298_9BACT|nr:T9SS type A sorting domain-containing protein [Geofilum rubicundum]GAO31644.1 hypothetical protein JCM15548_14030 [Geofilum rubicundum JCM 15548]